MAPCCSAGQFCYWINPNTDYCVDLLTSDLPARRTSATSSALVFTFLAPTPPYPTRFDIGTRLVSRLRAVGRHPHSAAAVGSGVCCSARKA
eukprot:9094537-Pyramimonas_sp.AAC.1